MDAAIHAPHTQSGSDERNYHAHIMFTGRQIDLETGDFAKKRNRDFNKENSSQTVNQWRETFADLTNQHLARAGHLSKVDHRSYADQDNGLQATIHEGSKVTQLRKQGIDTEISLKNDLIKQQNTEKQHLPEILKGLEQEIRLTESQIDKYKLDMSLETIRKLSSTMETPKPQQKPLDRKIEPSKEQDQQLAVRERDTASIDLDTEKRAIQNRAGQLVGAVTTSLSRKFGDTVTTAIDASIESTQLKQHYQQFSRNRVNTDSAENHFTARRSATSTLEDFTAQSLRNYLRRSGDAEQANRTARANTRKFNNINQKLEQLGQTVKTIRLKPSPATNFDLRNDGYYPDYVARHKQLTKQQDAAFKGENHIQLIECIAEKAYNLHTYMSRASNREEN